MADDSVYADQWKACADLMRSKAVEFDQLAKKAPIRPKESEAVMRAIVEARSNVDQLAANLKRCADLLAGES